MEEDFQKLLPRLSADPNRPQCVLLSTGAFAPVHLGHLKMLESAKRHLEAKGFNVVGGFLSPSHDTYVGGKGIDVASLLSAERRCSYIDAVTEHSEWLACSRWESQSCSSFVDYPQVTAQHVRALRNYLPSKVAVFYVCGSDHALKCYLLHRSPSWASGLVVMYRRSSGSAAAAPGAAVDPILRQMQRAVCKRPNMFLVQHDSCNRSSTAVRKALQEGSWSLVEQLCGLVVTAKLKTFTQ